MSDSGSFSLVDLFRQEIEVQGSALQQGLLKLEGDAAATPVIAEVMRAAHSIKGAARIVDVSCVAEVAHRLEDCLIAAQEKSLHLSATHIDYFLMVTDWLMEMGTLSEAELAAWPSANQERLQAILDGLAQARLGTPPVVKNAVKPTVEAEPVASQAEEPLEETAASEPSAPQAPPAEDTKKVQALTSGGQASAQSVRVAADSLNRLMSLAAESLVESGRLRAFRSDMLLLKQLHSELSRDCEDLAQVLTLENQISGAVATHLDEVRYSLQEMLKAVRSQVEELDGYARRGTLLSDRLYHEVLASRMRPFADGIQGFPRLVRDLGRSLSKQIRLVVEGEKTPVDRDILEQLEAPLNHLLRNACDHGIETVAERKASGKEETSTLYLRARHRSGMLLVEISDDGRGIDVEKIRNKVIERQLVGAEMAKNMSVDEVLDFLFLPGFSTASNVTEISGRGVGLDVVNTLMQQLGGIAKIYTEVGSGTTFHLQLPVTRSVVRSLIVDVCAEPYAFPLARMHRALRVPIDQIQTIESRSYIELEGQMVGLVAARDVFGLSDRGQAENETVTVVVVGEKGSLYGIVVDALQGEADLVVRPLDALLGKVPGISSAAVNEDGFPVLLVDVEDMLQLIDKLLEGGGLRRYRKGTADVLSARKTVLVVDDSITVRETERQLLESAGYAVETAVDGADGWNAARLGEFDLVVSDVDMPRMNGFELVAKLKQDQRLSKIPVIIVSYKDREEDKQRGLEVGADYYLTKSSFQDESFIQAVVDLIGRPLE